MYQEGDSIQDFTLPGTNAAGEEVDLTLSSLLQGRDYTILYFYPRDNTPGCTTEACDFRDNLKLISPKANVVGCSPDKPATHQKFREKQSLNFPLISDMEKKLMAQFGAFGEKKNYGKIVQGVIRSTFILDGQGTLLKAMRNIKAKGHVERILKELEALN